MNERRLVIRLIILVAVLLCTAGCDQATKHLARTKLADRDYDQMSGHFVVFTLAQNPGSFLSLGASLPEPVRGTLSILLAAGLAYLLVYLCIRPLAWAPFIGLSLFCAGGISNLADRFFRHGLVTDFMVVRAGPFHTGIFNLADAAIMLGAFIAVASFFLSSSRARTPISKPE